MGEPASDMSSGTLFFESEIPVELRVEILRLLANLNYRPSTAWAIPRFYPLMTDLGFRDSESIVLSYIEYLISFLYIDREVHEELLRVNKLRKTTDAASVATFFRRTGLPNYITTERVYEWYRCYVACHVTKTKGWVIREDDIGRTLVSLPPSVWSSRFIRPRLERLIANGTEAYRL